MIKLQKGPTPDILLQNSKNWTDTLRDRIATGQKATDAEKSRYRHPEIKTALVDETSGKCAYCESKLQHIHHGDVEHVFPKSLDLERSFEWENLTLACEICNQRKSNLDPKIEHIIDPYDVDPAAHLFFVGALIFSRGTESGKATRSILRLSRAELVEQRSNQLDRIMTIYEQILDERLALPVRAALYEDLKDTMSCSSAPYAAMARCVVIDMREKLPKDMRG